MMVSADDHAYLRVRPSEERLPADRTTGQFEQLHRAIRGQTIECLLVADPTSDEIAYYFGTKPSAQNTLYRILDRLTPDTYPIEYVDEDPLGAFEFEEPVAAEFTGVAERNMDWQTRLRPPTLSDAPEQHDTARIEAVPNLPLESVVQGMGTSTSTIVYQALLRPKPDWSGDAEFRVRRLDQGRDTFGQRLFTFFFGPVKRDDDDDDRYSPRRSAHRQGDSGSIPGNRINAILAKSSRNAYDINARVVADGPDAETTVTDLASTFNAIGGDFYGIDGEIVDDPAPVLNSLIERTFDAGEDRRSRFKRSLPITGNVSPQIVADSTTVPHFCLLDGGSLTETARRSLRALPEERTGITPPDTDKLAYYESGLALGKPLAQDGTPLESTISLPSELQPMHAAWFGKTGSGKSTSLINGILQNHAATDGADILFAPKGDGMPREYMRAHFAEYGTLENVHYFDCAEVLPALSFFDIRPQLADGVSRTTAITDIVDHYIDILRAVMADETFESAVRSPDVIRFLIKALFDSEYGAEAFTHRDLQRATLRLRESRTSPRVSDPELQGMLDGLTANDQQAFDAILQGVANRIEKIPLDDRLGRVFNHSVETHPESDPDSSTETDSESQTQPSHFDFRDVLDENAVIIFDLGELRSQSQRALTIVLLSKLWTALRRRKQQQANPPLVNVYLEEAASLAVTDLLTDLLSQSRGFNVSLTLAMQFPGQLREQSPRTYEEVLNNVGSIVTGNVAVDSQLQQRLATEAIPAEEVGNRLRALSRGEWMASLAAPYGQPRPQPFIMQSLPLPPGHPDGEQPLSPARETAFSAVLEAVESQTADRYGLHLGGDDSETEPVSDSTSGEQPTSGPITSTLPFTSRFPSCIEYNPSAGAIECGSCNSRHAPTSKGIREAIECCASLDRVDRDEIPVCEVTLRLSPGERAASDYTDRQLLFLQLVYDGQHQRFDPELEYDLCRDSMVRLREYAGLEAADVRALIDDGLLREDCTRPFRLYTVTPEGRNEIQLTHSDGVSHGPGVGDLGESSHHRLMVLFGAQYLRESVVADPDSAAVAVETYYERGEDRLDAVALDADENVIATLEAERATNDTARAALDDFDKMASCSPERAIWLCDTRETINNVLNALHDPITGSQRIEKTYSPNTHPKNFSIESAGLTEMTTLRAVMNDVDSRPTH